MAAVSWEMSADKSSFPSISMRLVLLWLAVSPNLEPFGLVEVFDDLKTDQFSKDENYWKYKNAFSFSKPLILIQ